MSIYAIGDIQGCFHTFQDMLTQLEFKPMRDQLWLVGDLINRGGGSLEVLRWCYQHQDSIKAVLGNHDLHALAVAYGIRQPHRSDTLQSIIDAPDADMLLTWLRQRPLLVSNNDYVMVHAGLLWQWEVEDAFTYAAEVERALQGDAFREFLRDMYGNTPNQWHDDLVGIDRLRLITNVMTRMRICTEQGQLDFDFKGKLKEVPVGYVPWFAVPGRKTQDLNIICGHWSALGLYQEHNINALDTGCLWGGSLTAMCFETKSITQVPVNHKDKPIYLKI